MNPQDSSSHPITCQYRDGTVSSFSQGTQDTPQSISGTRVCCGLIGRRAAFAKNPAKTPDRDPAGFDTPLEAEKLPTSLPLTACPRCQRQATAHRFVTDDGVLVMTYHCDQHGDVVPSAFSLKRLISEIIPDSFAS